MAFLARTMCSASGVSPTNERKYAFTLALRLNHRKAASRHGPPSREGRCELALGFVIDFVEVVVEQDKFGWNGCIRFKIEHPMPVFNTPKWSLRALRQSSD